MTEQEWLQATDPTPMLEFLQGKASDRKLRLFACASCRRVWSLLTEERSRRAVEVAERFVDGRAAAEELQTAYRAARDPIEVYHEEAAAAAAHEDAGYAAAWASEAAAYGPDEPAWRQHFAARRADQAALLCDLFGPLSFRPIIIDPGLLTWRDGLLASMAQKMYDRRDFSDMPVLADALEEGGCQDQEILGHCRSEGEHVRGCWVVDLLLGRS